MVTLAMKRLGIVCLLLIINLLLPGCRKYDVDRDVLPPGTPYTRENNAASLWLYIYSDKIEKRLDGKIADNQGVIFNMDCYIKAVNLSSERCLLWIENDDPKTEVFSGFVPLSARSDLAEKITFMSGETRTLRMPMQSSFTIALQIGEVVRRERWHVKQIGGQRLDDHKPQNVL